MTELDHNRDISVPLSYISSSNPEIFCPARLNLDTLINNGHYLFIAKRGSGKTTMIKCLIESLLNQQKIDSCVVFSPSERMEQRYKKFIPENNIYHEIDYNVIQQIINKQKASGINRDKVCVVMDNSTASTKLNNPVLTDLLMNSRDYGITLFMAMQYSIGFNPDLRNNFDYIFLFADDIISNLKRLYDHYAGMFPSFNTFSKTFLTVTKNYNTLCIINRQTNFIDKVKSFCATKTLDNFKVNKVYNYNDTQLLIKDNTMDKSKIFETLANIIEMNNKIIDTNKQIASTLQQMYSNEK